MTDRKKAAYDTGDHEPTWPLPPPRSSLEKELEKDFERRISTGSSTKLPVDALIDTPCSSKSSDTDGTFRAPPPHSHGDTRPVSTVTQDTLADRDPAYEMDFGEDDSGNPKNWNTWKQGVTFFVVTASNLVVLLYSTSYTATIPGIQKDFDCSKTVALLGLTTYLLGLAAGSFFLAPISEMYGRKPVYIIFMAIYTVFIIPAAIAKNLTILLMSRFFGAFAGSVMVSNGAGSISDLVREEHRGLAFSIFAIGPMNAPVFGPLIGGFVFENLGWRWNNWVALILAGTSFVAICMIPETYSPHILRKRTKQKRKDTGDDQWWSRYDNQKSVVELLKVNLSRPFVMAVKEPICIFWNLYISVVYATLYLCFVAYPIIFGHFRHWTPGKVGLSYLGIGAGSLLSSALEPVFRKLIHAHNPDPKTGRPTPEAMVSVMCVGALAIPLGEFIFAFTSLPPIHWIVPILAGVPFGMGNTIAFAYSNAYLANTYGVYAASALAGQSVLRSLAGGALPLAGPAMYEKLGPKWAGLTLAVVEFALVPIPFVFWRYGEGIRRKSKMIAQLRKDQERLDRRRAMIDIDQLSDEKSKKMEA